MNSPSIGRFATEDNF